jgi:RNA polymerase sigma-32 factor
LPDEVVEQSLDTDRRAQWLRDALSILSERELRIVQERRLTEESVTLESLGDKLGISKERVRQIENRALSKLRRELSRLQGDDVQCSDAQYA